MSAHDELMLGVLFIKFLTVLILTGVGVDLIKNSRRLSKIEKGEKRE